MSMGLLILPFVILWILVKILPPWVDAETRLATAGERVG